MFLSHLKIMVYQTHAKEVKIMFSTKTRVPFHPLQSNNPGSETQQLHFGKEKKESEVSQSCPTLCDPRGLQPARLLHPWSSPGKDTGMGCHFLLQGLKPLYKLEIPFVHSFSQHCLCRSKDIYISSLCHNCTHFKSTFIVILCTKMYPKKVQQYVHWLLYPVG